MKIILFILIFLLNGFINANVVSKNLWIEKVLNQTTLCSIKTSDGITSKCVDRVICNFATKLISIKPSILVTVERNQQLSLYEVVSMKLANKRTEWYNRKLDEAVVCERENFILNGLIDNIKLYNNNRCYISIADKSDEQNSYKYQKANDKLCEYSQDLFLRKINVTANIRCDPVSNNKNELVNIMPINKISCVNCKKTSIDVGGVETKTNIIHNKTRRRRTVATFDGRSASTHLRTQTKFKRDLEGKTMDMTNLLATYYELGNCRTLTPSRNAPVSEFGTVEVTMATSNQKVDVPLFVRATIYSDRVEPLRKAWTTKVEKQMTNMGKEEDDERGHLLARELGGSQEAWNIVPMAKCINSYKSNGHGSIEANPEINPQNLEFKKNLKEMCFPLSVWRSNEVYIKKYLRDNRGGYVDYWVVVQYENLITRFENRQTFRPKQLRPTHFTQHFVMYNAAKNKVSDHTYCVINDNSFQCANVEPNN